MIGTRVGPYEITAKLGEGGMGEVYRATDSKLRREVAIKVLPAAFTADKERLARFEREAQLLAQLHHPNIASIFGLEESGGVRALIMELVEGDDLSTLIERGPLPLGEAVPIARQIAEALEAAHEQGIVHRDLKPGNIKVRADGTVKVLDFGLAKALDTAGAASSAAELARSPTLLNSPTLTAAHGTQLGMILGTAAYMAPEQAAGRGADRRSDIWAFGVVLYEMLSGRRLFEGETVSHVLAGVLKDEPDFSALAATTPRRVVDLVRRCLRKRPRERLQAIGEARLVLEEVAGGALDEPAAVPAAAVVGRPSGRAIGLALAAALAVGALGTLAVLRYRAPASARPRTLSELPLPEGVFWARNGSDPALSADGTKLALALDEATQSATRIWVRTLATGDLRAVAGTEGGSLPFWSPDGRSLGFFAFRDRQLKRVDLEGGRPVALAKVESSCGGTWGHDAIFFCGAARAAIQRVAPTGGETSAVTHPAEGEWHYSPSLLADGQSLIYVAEPTSGAAAVRLTTIDGANDRALSPADSKAIVAEGRLFYLRGSTLLARPFDPGSGELGPGEAEIVAEGVETRRGGQFSVASGLLVFQPETAAQGTRIAIYDRAGGLLDEIDSETFVDDLVLSPDGRHAAVMRASSSGESDSDGNDVWTLDLERKLFSRSTFGEQDDDPVFSPEGSALAYVHDGSLYRKPVNGPGEPKLLAASAADIVTNEWTRDGWIVYSDLDRSGEDLLVVSAEGGEPRRLTETPHREANAQVSPDGRWLAYVSDEGGDLQVYLTSWPEFAGKWRVSSERAGMPRWRGDGRELYFLSHDSRLMAAAVGSGAREPELGLPRELFRVNFQGSYQSRTTRWAVTPDGSRFLVLEPLPGKLARSLPLILVTEPLRAPKGTP